VGDLPLGSGLFSWILAYLLGSISFSYLFTRWIKKVDIREFGSGNAGATNTRRVLGTPLAIVVLILDGLKGAVAVWSAAYFAALPTVMVIAGLMAIVGHNWPIFLNFRGGKGVATTIGVTAALNLPVALLACVLTIACIALTRYVSLGSLIYTSSVPLMMAGLSIWQSIPLAYVLGTLLMAVSSIWQHRENVKRLRNGTERKI
jgi:acyl phosphate:glycerol-3-phosphate acyltransferase